VEGLKQLYEKLLVDKSRVKKITAGEIKTISIDYQATACFLVVLTTFQVTSDSLCGTQ